MFLLSVIVLPCTGRGRIKVPERLCEPRLCLFDLSLLLLLLFFLMSSLGGGGTGTGALICLCREGRPSVDDVPL